MKHSPLFFACLYATTFAASAAALPDDIKHEVILTYDGRTLPVTVRDGKGYIGDMYLGNEYALDEFRANGMEPLEVKPPRRKIKGEEVGHRLWRGGRIPFVFETGLGKAHQQAVRHAMATFHEQTGILFEEDVLRTSKANTLLIHSSKTFCSAEVGMNKNRRSPYLVADQQTLSLTEQCFKTPASILHLLGHTVGLTHDSTARADGSAKPLKSAKAADQSIMQIDPNGSPLSGLPERLSPDDVEAIRQLYPAATTQLPVPGQIKTGQGNWCLTAEGPPDEHSEYSFAHLRQCNGSNAQVWLMARNGQVRSKTMPGYCLGWNGNEVDANVIDPCFSSTRETWTKTATDQLTLRDANSNRRLAYHKNLLTPARDALLDSLTITTNHEMETHHDMGVNYDIFWRASPAKSVK